MKPSQALVIFGFVLPLSAPAAIPALHSGEFRPGLDERSRACSLEVLSFSTGQPFEKSRCDFEIDGEGPWCNPEAKVTLTPVEAQLKVQGRGQTYLAQLNDEFYLWSPQEPARLVGTIVFNPEFKMNLSLKFEGKTLRSMSAYWPTPRALEKGWAAVREELSNSSNPSKTYDLYFEKFECRL